jgi:hypothetical protein
MIMIVTVSSALARRNTLACVARKSAPCFVMCVYVQDPGSCYRACYLVHRAHKQQQLPAGQVQLSRNTCANSIPGLVS